MDERLKEYLIQKYPEQFAGLMADTEAAASRAQKLTPGVGGHLLSGLRGAMEGRSYEDVQSGVDKQAQGMKANIMEPYYQKEKALKGQFDASKKAFDASEDFTKSDRNTQLFDRQTEDYTRNKGIQDREDDPNSVESKLAQQLAEKMGLKNNQLTARQFKDTSKYLSELHRLEMQKQLLNTRLASSPSANKPIANKSVEALNRNYAERYNEFTQKGGINAIYTIKNLEELADKIAQNPKGGGGRFAKIAPDVLRPREDILNRDQARNFANTTLKELFGGQLSDAEREAAAREYWNDAVSNEENAKIIKRKIETLKAVYENQLKKAQYYEDNNQSLEGYKGTMDVDAYVNSLRLNKRGLPSDSRSTEPKRGASGLTTEEKRKEIEQLRRELGE
jgi:hypothetical protein